MSNVITTTVADLLSAIDRNKLPNDHVRSLQGIIVEFPSAADKLVDASAIHIHVSIVNRSLGKIIHWARQHRIPCFVYHHRSDWQQRNRRQLIPVSTVEQLSADHNDRWWHRQYGQLLLDWIQLIYGTSYQSLSASARRTLHTIAKPHPDHAVIFDLVDRGHPPSIHDYRATLILDHQLNAHSIVSYDQFAHWIHRRWRQFIGNQRKL